MVNFGRIEPETQILGAVTAAVELGGDVNAANRAGDTALHAAAAQAYLTVVEFLAGHGARLDAKNQRGFTPLTALTHGRANASVISLDTTNPAPKPANPAVVALLRKLGAAE